MQLHCGLATLKLRASGSSRGSFGRQWAIAGHPAGPVRPRRSSHAGPGPIRARDSDAARWHRAGWPARRLERARSRSCRGLVPASRGYQGAGAREQGVAPVVTTGPLEAPGNGGAGSRDLGHVRTGADSRRGRQRAAQQTAQSRVNLSLGGTWPRKWMPQCAGART